MKTLPKNFHVKPVAYRVNQHFFTTACKIKSCWKKQEEYHGWIWPSRCGRNIYLIHPMCWSKDPLFSILLISHYLFFNHWVNHVVYFVFKNTHLFIDWTQTYVNLPLSESQCDARFHVVTQYDSFSRPRKPIIPSYMHLARWKTFSSNSKMPTGAKCDHLITHHLENKIRFVVLNNLPAQLTDNSVTDLVTV